MNSDGVFSSVLALRGLLHFCRQFASNQAGLRIWLAGCLVALAAGVNRTAATSKTRIIRKTATGFEEAQVDLKRLLQGKAADVALQPEDIVYIPPSSTKSILMRAPSLAQTAASAAVYSAVP